MTTPKLSVAACEQWDRLTSQLFEGPDKFKKIIIPVIAYTAGDNSNAGFSSVCDPLVITDMDSIFDMDINPDGEHCDIALNRNVLCLGKAGPPKLVTLDIIDTNPEYEGDIKLFTGYNALKTQNGFHLYSNNPSTINSADIIRDPNWKLEYIRITESIIKGAITKLD